MRRPLVIVALLYAAGLLLAEAVQPPMLYLVASGFALALIALCWPRARQWLAHPAIDRRRVGESGFPHRRHFTPRRALAAHN